MARVISFHWTPGQTRSRNGRAGDQEPAHSVPTWVVPRTPNWSRNFSHLLIQVGVLILPPLAATSNLISVALHFFLKCDGPTYRRRHVSAQLNCHKLNSAREPAARWRGGKFPAAPPLGTPKRHHAPFRSLPLLQKCLALGSVCRSLVRDQARQDAALQVLTPRKPCDNTVRPAPL